MTRWTNEDIDWAAFESSKVTPELLSAVKAAALVEFNSRDYVSYLRGVFGTGAEIVAALETWGEEEAQHGLALGRWAETADPSFDFEAAFAAFRAGYQLPIGVAESVRGSRAGELVSRCVIESGTSPFYTAMREATDEPVLKQIAGLIAADEFRHYKLFYEWLERFAKVDRPSRLKRLGVAVTRFREADDDELAFAYFCANGNPGGGTYDRKACARAYERAAMGLYRRRHIDRLIAMAARAAGLEPHGALARLTQAMAWRGLTLRQRLAKAA